MLNVAKAAYEQKKSGQKTPYMALAELVDQSELIQMIEEVDRLEVSCRRSSQPIMNLEIGLLSLCQRLDIVQWKAIEARLQKLEANILSPNFKQAQEARVLNLASESTIAEIVNKLAEDNLTDFVDKQVDQEPKKEPLETSILSGPVEKGTDEIEEAPNHKGANENIDLVWQNILSELQRRHLPTFSLVSTHAFPIEISDKTLTVGVFVENFQKMIENKVEYIKTAAIACNFDQNLRVVVRVQTDAETPSLGQKKNGINEITSKIVTAKVSSLLPNHEEDSLAMVPNISSRPDESEQEQRGVKEAYRLFEGPGSRYIAPSQ